MKNNLLIGYGNPDRGDDGAAYHLLVSLFDTFGIADVDLFSSNTSSLNADTDVLFNFQLLPEFSETIAKYQQVVFIDSHTGEIEEDISFEIIEPTPQYSPFTHHFSPSSCLAVVQSIAGRCPKAWLLSIRGFQFGFNRTLSQRTLELVEQALSLILKEFL